VVQVAGSPLQLALEGAGNCDAPGSRFVRTEARTWYGSAAITAFVDQDPGGAVPGTPVTVDPSSFFSPAVSNTENVAGQTVRPCVHVVLDGSSEYRCGEWVTVPW
jgi:hypothetical protein